MSKKGKENFQSLYAQEFKYGTFATDISGTKKDRDLHKKLTAGRVIASILVLLLLLGGANYLLAWKAGFILLPLGEEIIHGDGYTCTKTESLGFSRYTYEGSCADYTVIQLGASQPPEPCTLSQDELKELNRLLTVKYDTGKSYSPVSYYLEADTFLGLHVYGVRERKGGLRELYGTAYVCGYAGYKDNVYLLEEEYFPVILQIWDDNGTMRLHSVWGDRYTHYYEFESLMPDGMVFGIDDSDITHAHQLCDEAAEEALGGTVVLDVLEVSESGHLQIFRPDIEGYNPDVDTELKYELIETNRLKQK